MATPTTRPTVAFLGNPNTGKTTLFNALSGLRQRTGNYPGVTVETRKGQMTYANTTIDLIDLPGTYSLAPRSPDEMVTVDVILGQQKGEPPPNVVVSIVDASNLERNLYLTTQALEMGVPVIVALNMMDVAATQGLKIDVEQLSRRLGLPIVPLQAHRGIGLNELRQAIVEVVGKNRNGAIVELTKPAFPEAFENEVKALRGTLEGEVPRFLVRRLLLDIGGFTEQRLSQQFGESLKEQVTTARKRLADAGCGVPAVEAKTRYAWIRQMTAGVVERPAQRPVTWTDRLDKVLTHRVWGLLIFLLVMFVVFQSIFTVAKPLMEWIDNGKSLLTEWLRDDVLPGGPLTSLFLDGILNGVGSVLIFLPQILILFGFIAILEDCGYMARAAFLMDKLMSRCGLSGKSFIPLLSSLACAIPGIMSTRVIENKRDRLATILVAPLMSCSARLPVYILLIGAFIPSDGGLWWLPGFVMFCMYAIGLLVAPLIAFILKRTLLKGETPLFVMEMPSYKWPSWRIVGRRMIDSGWSFVYRAGTLILASMVVVWALLYFPDTDANGEAYEERLAKLEEPVAADRKILEAKEKSIEKETKAIKELKKREKKASEDEKPELAKQREEIETRIAPTTKEIDALKEKTDPVDEKKNALIMTWKENSCLGWMGKKIEPVVKPLGWDWKIGMAALASFPAREVVVGTLGIIYGLGEVDAGEIEDADEVGETDLAKKMQSEGYTIPTALSLMVFFALCCQCVSTLAVIRRETRSWFWPLFTFVYMTLLAYGAAFVVYQVGTLFC